MNFVLLWYSDKWFILLRNNSRVFAVPSLVLFSTSFIYMKPEIYYLSIKNCCHVGHLFSSISGVYFLNRNALWEIACWQVNWFVSRNKTVETLTILKPCKAIFAETVALADGVCVNHSIMLIMMTYLTIFWQVCRSVYFLLLCVTFHFEFDNRLWTKKWFKKRKPIRSFFVFFIISINWFNTLFYVRNIRF